MPKLPYCFKMSGNKFRLVEIVPAEPSPIKFGSFNIF